LLSCCGSRDALTSILHPQPKPEDKELNETDQALNRIESPTIQAGTPARWIVG
jgi:hypothetical protein